MFSISVLSLQGPPPSLVSRKHFSFPTVSLCFYSLSLFVCITHTHTHTFLPPSVEKQMEIKFLVRLFKWRQVEVVAFAWSFVKTSTASAVCNVVKGNTALTQAPIPPTSTSPASISRAVHFQTQLLSERTQLHGSDSSYSSKIYQLYFECLDSILMCKLFITINI